MKVEVPYTIYIITNTKFGTRYVFYVSTPSRGLNHGLDNGIHHGLGKHIKWEVDKSTRDVKSI